MNTQTWVNESTRLPKNRNNEKERKEYIWVSVINERTRIPKNQKQG